MDDVVIVKDDSLSRNRWKLARVSETYPDNDGLVKKVRIVVASDALDDLCTLNGLSKNWFYCSLQIKLQTGESPPRSHSSTKYNVDLISARIPIRDNEQ